MPVSAPSKDSSGWQNTAPILLGQLPRFLDDSSVIVQIMTEGFQDALKAGVAHTLMLTAKVEVLTLDSAELP